LAMPSVRAMAKEMGVDLNMVRGTGQGGRVLRQDVEDYAQAAAYGRTTVEAPSLTAEEAPAAEPWMGGQIEQTDHGVVERVVFRGVRRTMARRMAEAVAKQALVTTTEEADVSILRRIREKERNLAAERGVRLTYLAFVVKACAVALKRFPRLNAELLPDCEEVLVKRYYNIGLAVDTKAGLMVPNIKSADKKSIFQIAEEIMDLVSRSQDRKLDLAELHGGTFTITNYGAIGGIYGTPVMNYPEVAILGMGRVRDVPVVQRGDVVIRQLLPLSLTFDHQLIDGAEAARFLNLVISYIEDPDLLLLESI
jgi:pyruvate dehydrogenase E2 component (dihydrolipoamide acetyltransferase)